MEEHIISGGDFEEIMKVITDEMNDSDFFRNLSKRAEEENGEKQEEKSSRINPIIEYKTQRELFEKEWFPKAHAMGVSWNKFWTLNPRSIRRIADRYSEKMKQQDYLNWVSNQYTLSAVSVAIDRVLNGKNQRQST